MYRQIKRRGLLADFRREGLEGHGGALSTTIKLSMSLAFLPEGRMEEGVREMEAEAAESEDERVIEFAAYVRTQWLERVGASVVSVHGQSRRTNNGVESFHRGLSRRFQPHPNLLHFLGIYYIIIHILILPDNEVVKLKSELRFT